MISLLSQCLKGVKVYGRTQVAYLTLVASDRRLAERAYDAATLALDIKAIQPSLSMFH